MFCYVVIVVTSVRCYFHLLYSLPLFCILFYVTVVCMFECSTTHNHPVSSPPPFPTIVIARLVFPYSIFTCQLPRSAVFVVVLSVCNAMFYPTATFHCLACDMEWVGVKISQG